MNTRQFLYFFFIGQFVQLFKEWRCKPHDYMFVRNIYGDQINIFNARSEWVCTKCGKWHYSMELFNKDSTTISDFHGHP